MVLQGHSSQAIEVHDVHIHERPIVAPTPWVLDVRGNHVLHTILLTQIGHQLTANLTQRSSHQDTRLICVGFDVASLQIPTSSSYGGRSRRSGDGSGSPGTEASTLGSHGSLAKKGRQS